MILFAPKTSSEATPYLVHCRYGCGESKFLSYAEYCRQMAEDPGLPRCPRCGAFGVLDEGHLKRSEG